MRLKLFACVLVVLLLSFAGSAKADTVTINGSYAFASNGYGIPPYGGALNGVSQSFYCVDFASTIAPPYSWQVTVSSLTGTNFSATKLGNQTSYLEMAWLVTQMMGTTNQLQQAKDQFATWSLTGGPNPYGTNSALVAAALAAVKAGFSGAGWEILSPTGSAGQEFLMFVGVPEPATLLMLLVGLGVLMLITRKRSAAAAQAI